MKKIFLIFCGIIPFVSSCNYFSGNKKGLNEIITKTKYSTNYPDIYIVRYTFDCDTGGNVTKINRYEKQKTYVYELSHEKNVIHEKGQDTFWYLDSTGRVKKMVQNKEYLGTVQFNFTYDDNGHLFEEECFNINTKKKYFVLNYDYSDGNLIDIRRTSYVVGDDPEKVLVKFSYTDQIAPPKYIPYMPCVTSFMTYYRADFNSSMEDYLYPQNFLGKQSKNLINSITIPEMMLEDYTKTYQCSYQLNVNNNIQDILITNDLTGFYCKSDINYDGESNPIAQNNTSVAVKRTLKTLDEVKMALIDGRNEKADIFLGQPDYKGRIMDDNTYYMVYFDKVTDKGHVKNLLLLINGSGGIDKTSRINYIDAINDGQTVSGVANGFIWLRVSKNSITSNCGGLTICNGNIDWSDVRDGRREMLK